MTTRIPVEQLAKDLLKSCGERYQHLTPEQSIKNRNILRLADDDAAIGIYYDRLSNDEQKISVTVKGIIIESSVNKRILPFDSFYDVSFKGNSKKELNENRTILIRFVDGSMHELKITGEDPLNRTLDIFQFEKFLWKVNFWQRKKRERNE